MSFEEKSADLKGFLNLSIKEKFFSEFPEKKTLYEQGGLVETDPSLTTEAIPDANKLRDAITKDREDKLKKLILETYPEETTKFDEKLKNVLAMRPSIKDIYGDS